MSKFGEFFDVKGVPAMRNLTAFIGVIVGSVVVLILTWNDSLTGDIFAIYMLATGGIYGFGKWQDDKTRRSEIEASSDPAINNNLTINQPKNVNIPPK